MAALDRLDLLVNNELFADVVFAVGSEGTLMFGHKAILTVASDVFRAQFTGGFRESRENGQEHEIPVIDIEPPVFKEILRYAYCDRVTITADNVLHLLYAAEKYLLAKLTKKCTDFVDKHLCEENVLQMFVQNRSYELEDINRKCLDIICANPIRMFRDEHFVTLDSKSLKLFAKCKRMNCLLTDLVSAILFRLMVNEHDKERCQEILRMVQKRKQLDHMCNYIYNFSSGLYRKNITCEMKISANRPLYIHGIGVALKSQRSSIEQKSFRLNLSIKHFGGYSTNAEIERNNVKVSVVERVLSIMFERQQVKPHLWLHIIIQIGNTDWPMYTTENFTADQRDVGLNIVAEPINCVKYLLYTEESLTPAQSFEGNENEF